MGMKKWLSGVRKRRNQLYNLVELYEVVKATDQLYKLITLSDVPFDLLIN